MDKSPRQTGTFGQQTIDTNSSSTQHESTTRFEQQVRPFTDLDFFEKRISGKSRILRINPELTDIIANALNTDDDQQLEDTADLISLARQIDTPVNDTIFNRVLSTVVLQKEILAIHKDYCASDASAAPCVTLIQRMYEQLAAETEDDQLEEYHRSAALVGHLLGKLPDSSDTYKWMQRRLAVLEHEIGGRRALHEYMQTLPGSDKEPVLPEQIARDSDEVATLFRAAHNKQSYGVKLSYKEQKYRPGSLVYLPSDIFDTAGDLVDPTNSIHAGSDDSYKRLLGRHKKNELCIVTDSTNRTFLKGPIYKAKLEKDGEVDFVSNVNERYSFAIHPDGSLHSTGNAEGESLAELAARHGRYASYRRLQAEVIANYLDLTNPLEVTAHAVDLDKQAPGGVTTTSGSESSDPMDVVRRLIIPRIKAKTNAPTEDHESNGRAVRLHGVTWHIRRLPEGWHASGQAEMIAKQAGVTLKPGETFVQSHQRGSAALGRVTAHILISR